MLGTLLWSTLGDHLNARQDTTRWTAAHRGPAATPCIQRKDPWVSLTSPSLRCPYRAYLRERGITRAHNLTSALLCPGPISLPLPSCVCLRLLLPTINRRPLAAPIKQPGIPLIEYSPQFWFVQCTCLLCHQRRHRVSHRSAHVRFERQASTHPTGVQRNPHERRKHTSVSGRLRRVPQPQIQVLAEDSAGPVHTVTEYTEIPRQRQFRSRAVWIRFSADPRQFSPRSRRSGAVRASFQYKPEPRPRGQRSTNEQQLSDPTAYHASPQERPPLYRSRPQRLSAGLHSKQPRALVHTPTTVNWGVHWPGLSP